MECLSVGQEALRQGDLRAADALLRRALALAPGSPGAHERWLDLLTAAQDWAGLVAWSERGLALTGHPRSSIHLALGLLRLEAFEEAMPILRRLAGGAPAEAALWGLIADGEEAAGRPHHALLAHERALALDTGNADVAMRAASFLDRAAGPPAVLARFGRHLAPLSAPAGFLASLTDRMAAVGQDAEAMSHLLRMARRWPEDPSAADWLMRAAGLAYGRGDGSTMHLAMRLLVVVAPDAAVACSNLADILKSDHPEVALAWARRALAIAPDLHQAHGSVAAAHMLLEQLVAAEAPLRRALALLPSYVPSAVNLSQLLLMDNRLEEAERLARRQVAIEPGNPTVVTNLGQALLALGRVREGYPLHESRTTEPGNPPTVRTRIIRPRWAGEPLDGRSLLVWPDLGLGDQFFFSRYLPMLPATDGRIFVECDPRVETLYRRSFPNLTIAPWRDRVDDMLGGAAVDLQISSPSLPLVLLDETERAFDAARSGTYEPPPRFFVPSQERVAAWEATLAPRGRKLRVGISWRGGNLNAVNNPHYMTAAAFASILRGLPITAVNVQYSWKADEIAYLSAELEDFYHPPIDLKNDLDDVTALLACCDLVIAPTTAVVFLASGVGIPTWCFLTGTNWVASCFDRHPLISNLSYLSRRIADSWDGIASRLRAGLIDLIDHRAAGDTSLAPEPGHPRHK